MKNNKYIYIYIYIYILQYSLTYLLYLIKSLFILHSDMIGDFNCHSQNWGFTDTDNDGHELEAWAEINKITLIYDH